MEIARFVRIRYVRGYRLFRETAGLPYGLVRIARFVRSHFVCDWRLWRETAGLPYRWVRTNRIKCGRGRRQTLSEGMR